MLTSHTPAHQGMNRPVCSSNTVHFSRNFKNTDFMQKKKDKIKPSLLTNLHLFGKCCMALLEQFITSRTGVYVYTTY